MNIVGRLLGSLFGQDRLGIRGRVALSAMVAGIFAFRWGNTLPFSGSMPVLDDIDSISIWAKYLIYAREPLGLPLGKIYGIAFPFAIASLSNSVIALVAMPMKILSKVFPALATFYYLPTVEIVSVFLTGTLAALLIREFGVRKPVVIALGVVLVALSPPVVHRSSHYYGVSLFLPFFPCFLWFGYSYVRTMRTLSWKQAGVLALPVGLAPLVDPYLSLTLGILYGTALVLHLGQVLLWRDGPSLRRLLLLGSAFALGLALASVATRSVGNVSKLENPPQALTDSLDFNRHTTVWGYGGGYGGGFHVADVLSLLVAPDDAADIPRNKHSGPQALLARLGYPLTNRVLQGGQYEGFAFLGSIAVLILLWLGLLAIFSVFRGRGFVGAPGRVSWKETLRESVFGPAGVLGACALAAYIFSWGYILHVAGHRFNDILTPAYFVAKLWPKFIYARSLGRLSMPMSQFVLLYAVVVFGRQLEAFAITRKRQAFVFAAIVALVSLHLVDVWGYLKQSPATRGDDIVNALSPKDAAAVKSAMYGRRALMLLPGPRAGADGWCKTAYSLAYHSGIPISGSDTGFGLSTRYQPYFQIDLNAIAEGDFRAVMKRYGNVGFAMSEDLFVKVKPKVNVQMDAVHLQSRGAVILTPAAGVEIPAKPQLPYVRGY